MSWSEAGDIHHKAMDVQIYVLRRIPYILQIPHKTIHCENEDKKAQSSTFCKEMGTELRPVAENKHEANGLIENYNRVLRSFYHSLRLCDSRSCGEIIVAKSLFGKNISTG